ncbi:uncharacterized protein LOC131854478 [Achroia grisella]|uniref:uncharacterized protein LOC131854478 n=1 Tax=Achroia grisella TaxID=688607 RepID=UPI0027D1FEA7|nr:uncharacterized protein LOC131854478 [Achroia grisella]
METLNKPPYLHVCMLCRYTESLKSLWRRSVRTAVFVVYSLFCKYKQIPVAVLDTYKSAIVNVIIGFVLTISNFLSLIIFNVSYNKAQKYSQNDSFWSGLFGKIKSIAKTTLIEALFGDNFFVLMNSFLILSTVLSSIYFATFVICITGFKKTIQRRVTQLPYK